VQGYVTAWTAELPPETGLEASLVNQIAYADLRYNLASQQEHAGIARRQRHAEHNARIDSQTAAARLALLLPENPSVISHQREPHPRRRPLNARPPPRPQERVPPRRLPLSRETGVNPRPPGQCPRARPQELDPRPLLGVPPRPPPGPGPPRRPARPRSLRL